MLSVIRRVSDLRTIVSDWRAAGRRIGFVPTMGALHEGHASLVRASLESCDKTVVSIYVNPLQFDRDDDFKSYARQEAEDRELLEHLSAHVLFVPREGEVYRPGFATVVTQQGLTDHLCGSTRAGHFDGVLTIVLKLLNMVNPHEAFFGSKDYQQAQVVRRMVTDLDLPVNVRVMPIVREPDGLALSSRNARLTDAQREYAPRIRAAMLDLDTAFRDGESSARRLVDGLVSRLQGIPEARVDYAEICHPENLTPRTEEASDGDLLAVAVFLGSVRLIDNLRLGS